MRRLNGNTGSGSRIHIVETLIGIFAVTQDNDIIERVLYPRDAKKIDAALERQAAGEPSKEMSEMVEKLIQRGFESVIITNAPLTDALRGAGVKVEITEGSGPEDFVRENIESIAVDFRAVKDEMQYYARAERSRSSGRGRPFRRLNRNGGRRYYRRCSSSTS